MHSAYILPPGAACWRCLVRKQDKFAISGGSMIFFSCDIFASAFFRLHIFSTGRLYLALLRSCIVSFIIVCEPR